MLKLNKNSIEFLPVLVSDRLGGISTLDGYVKHYRVTDINETQVVAWTTCNNDGMTVLPLIDTTVVGFADGGTYKLYIRIAINPEVPILGPFSFEVS